MLSSSTGEWTDVASAKRGVRGTLSELSDDELEEVPVRLCVKLRAAGRFFSLKLKPVSSGVLMTAASGAAAAMSCCSIVSCVSEDGPLLSMLDIVKKSYSSGYFFFILFSLFGFERARREEIMMRRLDCVSRTSRASR